MWIRTKNHQTPRAFTIASIFDRHLHACHGADPRRRAAAQGLLDSPPPQGHAPTVITASYHIAAIHPSLWISVFALPEA